MTNLNRRYCRQHRALIVGLLVVASALGILSAAQEPAQNAPPGPVQERADHPVPPLPAPEDMFRRTAEEPVLPRPGDVPSVPGDVSILALPAVGGVWTAQGPGPILNGQVEGITGGHVVGAVQAIVAHPTNADIVWLGAVNGGLWKTTNATSASPAWAPQGDRFASLSIGALQLDPTDGTHNTLVAGFGNFSSFGRVGGPRTGVLRTIDGGATWNALPSGLLSGKNISGLAARGATIVVSVNDADSLFCNNLGIFRSVDSGTSFTQVTGGATGLPMGRAFDLATDPSNPAILYVPIRDAVTCSGLPNGIYRSVDTGATWTKVSNAAMDALLLDTVTNNTRMAVGLSGQVYVGIVNNGRLAGLFRSGNTGASWTQLDTPSTNEGGSIIGMQPTEKPGGQGGIHFSIVADPTDVNIVYLGGDRQPLAGDGLASTPNSLGAFNYTGRLFRVNAALPPGTQSTSLTHCATATPACNNTVSTSSNSAPHADSRRMVFDAAGNILEGDDGGIYRRTNPRTTGNWFSMMGNLRVTEMHDVAYDTVSNMVISGNQDTGTSEQTSVGGLTWNEVSQADGGDVAVDDASSASQSTRYSSNQNLGSFRRRVVNAAGVTTSTVFPARIVIGGGPPFQPQFVTPVEINRVDPTRILIAGANFLYESLDRGDTVTVLTGTSLTAAAIVYGGRSGGVDNPALIYAIGAPQTNPPSAALQVYLRTAGAGAPVPTPAAPGTASLRDIAVDPSDWRRAYVVNSIGEVWATDNAGTSWTNITGNLGQGSTNLRTVIVVPGTVPAVVVGGGNGVFRMGTDAVGVWNQLGTGMTNAAVWDLDYDPADDVLVAGSFGRGAWTLTPVANAGPLIPPVNVSAIAITPTTVNVSWSAAPGAASYRVYRSADRVNYSLVGSPIGAAFLDVTAAPNTSYLYKVRSFAGVESGDSALDLATTVIFTDQTLLVTVTPARAAHFTELLSAVNAVRGLAGLGAVAFSAPAPAAGTTIRAQHLVDLRSGLAPARAVIGLPEVILTDPTIVPGSTPIKAAHLIELRAGVM